MAALPKIVEEIVSQVVVVFEIFSFYVGIVEWKLFNSMF
jgi:hypothetical protein